MIRRFLAAAAAALLITGCSGNEADDTPSADENTPTTAASTTESAGDPAQWVLTPEGFGEVKLGSPVPEGYTLEPETECTGQQLMTSDGKPAVEVWTAENGEVTTIEATEAVATDKGVKIGDEASAVAGAYPDAKAQELSGIEAHVLSADNRALVFEVVDGKVAHISVQPLAGLHSVAAIECSE